MEIHLFHRANLESRRAKSPNPSILSLAIREVAFPYEANIAHEKSICSTEERRRALQRGAHTSSEPAPTFPAHIRFNLISSRIDLAQRHIFTYAQLYASRRDDGDMLCSPAR